MSERLTKFLFKARLPMKNSLRFQQEGINTRIAMQCGPPAWIRLAATNLAFRSAWIVTETGLPANRT